MPALHVKSRKKCRRLRCAAHAATGGAAACWRRAHLRRGTTDDESRSGARCFNTTQ